MQEESKICDFNQSYYKAIKTILYEKNLSEAMILLSSLESVVDEKNRKKVLDLKALTLLEAGKYQKASILYEMINKPYAYGYCELMLGNDKKAREIWYGAKLSPAIEWGRCMVNFINLKAEKFPTFLQIRNFLECDLGYLLKANQIKFAENLISCQEVLAEINIESYKFIGRALMNNGYASLSAEFFFKSQKLIPNDPEIYYHLAQYSYLVGEYEDSIKMAGQCVKINGEYTPAIKLAQKAKLKLEAK